MIDLRSDTVTQPTPAMRKAMAEALVGDDVYEDDPTTNELEALAASILGKEAALFVPSGTMGNQLAVMTHTRRGDEAIVSRNCHIFEHEVGAAAVLSGVTLNELTFEDGVYDASIIEAAIRPDDIHEPETTLICLENALANGRVVPLEVMQQVKVVGEQHGIPIHLDGARIFNAATYLQCDVKALADCVDSISCCLSKGLCAPIGSMLCGTKEFIARARKYRKMLGGGMRQTGILAAAGILALTEMPKRLQEDHDNARYLAEQLITFENIDVNMSSVQINMVFAQMNWSHLDELPAWMKDHNVLINPAIRGEMRFVTHYGVEKKDIDEFINLLKQFQQTHG